MIKSIRPFLWFTDGKAEAATRFYTSVFPNSSIERTDEMTTSFTLAGQRFIALNGDADFAFTEAISMFVTIETQAEVDHLWDKLTNDGGAPVQCGWLKDKKAAFGAMMKMVRIDLAELDRAVAAREVDH